ncbi:hypothetical protein FE782_01305 [Paenibacillus antri]|uniref:VCBS repeat-containing protein n=1 Tax=Paenibacillus antri TaxID=2582848 RepID=A0A5R9GHQ7_9BACL|nr:hypothetical protein [Paenibacillus antri]TLS54016.1 hypothetical protein FE782_01305 [Paenibacillus antri]
MRPCIVRALSTAGLLLTLAACAEREAPPAEAAPVPLTFRSIESTDIGLPAPRPGEWEETILERPIEGGTAYVYAIADDSEHLYGAIAFDGEELARGVGPVGGPQPAYDAELLSIAEISFGGKRVIRFKGVYGANAPVAVYADAEKEEADTVLLRVDTGNAMEVDLDGDGTEEVVSEHGLPSQAYVYRWEGGRFEYADVNEALDADSVRYVAGAGVFEAYSISTETTTDYRYAPQGLTLVEAEGEKNR